MAAFDHIARFAPRRWAVYATCQTDPVEFAEWVRAKGYDWRPVAVAPERLATAVANIQPVVVIIDPRLPRPLALERQARAAALGETFVALDPAFPLAS